MENIKIEISLERNAIFLQVKLNDFTLRAMLCEKIFFCFFSGANPFADNLISKIFFKTSKRGWRMMVLPHWYLVIFFQNLRDTFTTNNVVFRVLNKEYKTYFLWTARRIRGDVGTENINIAAIQMFFRKDHQGLLSGEKSFLFGKSTSNQVR